MKDIIAETGISHGLVYRYFNNLEDILFVTVAEGVEDQAHIDFLRSINCDMVQGYYYAKPMPAGDFTELLRQNHKNQPS